jgi:replicative DNA helicase
VASEWGSNHSGSKTLMGKTDVMLHFTQMSGWAGFLPLVFFLEMPQKLINEDVMS